MDLLIRDVPENVAAALDAEARRLGLSRSEYLRRALSRLVPRADQPVTVADLTAFAETFTDLADDETMDRAWR